jgi:hypothetical protein
MHQQPPAILPTNAVAGTGATSIFVMKGTPMTIIWPADQSLTINLPDRTIVKSTHVCNLKLPGLPTVLEGHIVPYLSMVLLVRICILYKAGCIVVFTDMACYVMCNKNLF